MVARQEGGDALYMAQALALAERGRGRTTPNPMVGALVVDDDGVIVGRGAHEVAGGPHAEIHALRSAGERARGATLYCTLEPCCHTGRTGPCAPEVVAAGIRRAVIAVEDPNPLVSGGGIAHLRRHGVEVTVGVLRERAQALNRPFFTAVRFGRPFVTMKAALSLDACVAGAGGTPVRLTGAAANRLIHRERAEVDAIAVGSGTILADDPLLTARGAYRYRPLARVIFDRRLRTPPSARVLSTVEAGPVIIVTRESNVRAGSGAADALRTAGAHLVGIDADETAFLPGALRALLPLTVTSVVVEGGPSLHAALWAAGLVDRVELYVAPVVLGPDARRWVPYPDVRIDALDGLTARPVGADAMIDGYVHRTD